MEAATKKRTHYGKRTTEQALCRRCSRMHSPHSNQMVFCDGCNEGWHQMCHEPWIEDVVVKNVGREWFCAACQAKRDKQLGGASGSAAKRRKESAAAHAAERRISWIAKTTAQVRWKLMERDFLLDRPLTSIHLRNEATSHHYQHRS
jgi:hypothetical protein